MAALLKNKTIYRILAPVLVPIALFAQLENWAYTYDGPEHNDDLANAIVYGPDSCLYVAGYSYNAGGPDFLVAGLTRYGAQKWIYTYNGWDGFWDEADAIAYGADGNIYAAGICAGDVYDFAVISLTNTGQQNWIYKYSGTGGSISEEAYAIVCGTDGNIYASGTSYISNYDFTVISLTAAGDTNWVYRYNGPGNGWDGALSIAYGADGNIYATGRSDGTSSTADIAVISLTPGGGERWVYRYNGPGNFFDESYSIVYGADGNVYVGGYSWGSGTSDWDFTVLSLTANGQYRWVYRWNGPGDGNDVAKSLVYGADGNIYAAGECTGIGTDVDLTIISLTPTGLGRWVIMYNGPGNGWDGASSIAYGSDTNIYVAGASRGTSNGDFIVLSYDTSGVENWRRRYNGSGNGDDGANSIVYGLDGRVYAAGISVGSGTNDDLTILGIGAYPPPSPLLIGPSNDSYLNSSSVGFLWHSSNDIGSGVEYYQLQYGSDSTFIYPDSVAIADTFYTTILSDTAYYWKVKTVDSVGNQSSWSDAWSFTIDTQSPQAPVLLYPLSGICLGDTMVPFRWSEVIFKKGLTSRYHGREKGPPTILSSPVRYVLEVDTLAAFTSPLVADTVDTNEVSVNIAEKFYYWRVKAYDFSGNQGPYSDTDSFGVDITPPLIDSTTVWQDTSYTGPFPVYTNVTDNVSGLDSVNMYFKRQEDPAWFIIPMMAGTSNWFYGEIPQVYTANDTVRYYIYARDAVQNEATDPNGAPANHYWFIANSTGIQEAHEVHGFSFGPKCNPSRNALIFKLIMQKNASVKLRIYDVSGRLIEEPLNSVLNAGAYEVLSSTNINAGVYIYVFESSGQKKMGKIIVLE